MDTAQIFLDVNTMLGAFGPAILAVAILANAWVLIRLIFDIFGLGFRGRY